MAGDPSAFRPQDSSRALAIRATIANMFLLFPLIVMMAEAVLGRVYDTVPFKYFVYVLGFALMPLIGVGASWLHRRLAASDRVTSLLEIALIWPGLTAVLFYLLTNRLWAPWSRIESIATAAGVAELATMMLAVFLPSLWTELCQRVCRPVAGAGRLALPLICAAIVFLGKAPWLLAHLIGDRAFQLGMLGGAGLVGTVYAGPPLLASRVVGARVLGRLLLAVCGIGAVTAILVAAFPSANPCPNWPDNSLPQTWSPFIATAAAVLAGGVPMVDVWGQYGLLPYLVYAAVFKVIFPPSYFSSFAITQFFNLLGPAIAVVICLKTARNKFLVLVVIAAIVPVLPWMWIINPASGGGRFAPPMLLLLALAWLRPGRTISWATLAAMLVCAFWSMEVLGWVVAGYVSFLAAVYLNRCASLRRCLAALVLTLSSIVAAHFAFCLATYVFSGSWPQYAPYFGFGWALIEAWWNVAPELEDPLWILQSAVCIVGLVYALANFRGAKRTLLGSDCRHSSVCRGLRSFDVVLGSDAI